MLIPIIVLGVLLLLNGVFAMSELAVMRSRPSRLRSAAERGSKGAAAALALASDPSRFLSTVQVGITVIGIFSGAFAQEALADDLRGLIGRSAILAPYAEGISLVIVVGAITYFSLVIGELVPKRLAIAHPEAISSLIAPPLRLLSVAAAPLVKVLSLSTELVARAIGARRKTGEDVSEDDVRALMSSAASTGVLDPVEHRLMQRVLRVADLRVASLMVPRSEVVWLDEAMTPDQVRAVVAENPHAYLPVCRGGMDHVVGIVGVKDLLARGGGAGAHLRLRDVMTEPLFVPETMNALHLLEMLQERRVEVAVVVDEYGGTEGFVTLDDVVWAVIGRSPRRRAQEPPRAHAREDGSWLLDGGLSLFETENVLGIPHAAAGEPRAANTVGGLMVELLGRIPGPRDSTSWGGWRLEVMDMDGHRVDAVLATPLPPPDQTPPAPGEDAAI